MMRDGTCSHDPLGSEMEGYVLLRSKNSCKNLQLFFHYYSRANGYVPKPGS